MKLPFNFCQKHQIVLTKESDHNVLFCLKTPSLLILDELSIHPLSQLIIKIVELPLLEETLQKLYGDSDAVAQIALDTISQDNLEDIATSLNNTQDLLDSNDDAPITKLINVLIAQAVREQASDIHIEVYENRMRIRFRVDGVLREVIQPNYALASRIIARIKVMAKLDIAEKRLPQDGRISTRLHDKTVDIRVSSMPTAQAEKIVLRLLEKQTLKLNLSHLGLPDTLYQDLFKLINQTQGVILVTGPTGSGKTTTLYAALAELNDTDKNIMTVEDPIEYDLDGINQTAVNVKTQMTFAKSLRAMLRQDPDVIMVGEVRDEQTVKIAIQASLTGHLVFSTLHTNTAIGAISRLRDMGVEPFLIASSLAGVLAQRLVRLLCHECKTELILISKTWQKIFANAQQQTIYQSKGCVKCNNSGYHGRIGIYELVKVDEKLQDLIHNKVAESSLLNYHTKQQRTLKDNALDLVLAGQTSLDEVYRVLGNE